MHELVARGAAAVRRHNGWTQEQAARAYRNHGLSSWRTSTVGSLESGLRKPRLDEVILMCAALDVTLADLIRAADDFGGEPVELGDGVVFSTAVILSWLYAGHDQIGDLPISDPRLTQRYPFSDKAFQVARQAIATRERLNPVLRPIVAWGVQHGVRLDASAIDDANRSPSDAERHASRRLGVDPAQVRLAALALWRRDLDQERDDRVGEGAEMEPRSRQARRGLVTREMLAEMERMLKEANELPHPEGDS
jgi:transcriptional regulator with XRE-family HTH domain